MANNKELIQQAIGEASLCWTPAPEGVFDSTKAEDVAQRLFDALFKIETVNQCNEAPATSTTHTGEGAEEFAAATEKAA